MIARGIFLLLISVAAIVGGCGTTNSTPQHKIVRPEVSVLTYNIQYDAGTPQATVDAIFQANADIVCLQEVSPDWAANLQSNLRGRYPYGKSAATDVPYAGVMILSRFPIQSFDVLKPGGRGWFPACVAVIDTPLGLVQVLNVHLRPLISDDGSALKGYFTVQSIHRDEIESLIQRLDPKLPILIAGDFNEGNNGNAAVWLTKNGYIDTLPKFDTKTPTWHGRIFGADATYRNDHVLIPASFTSVDARVLQAGASDHYPVLSVIGPGSSPAGSN